MEYIIGAGAILDSGGEGSITPATIHAQVDAALAGRVLVAAIDFESTSESGLRRLLVIAQGWDSGRFHTAVTARLLRHGSCSLADVLGHLAQGGQSHEVHVFAHWLPDDATCAALAAEGIAVVAHPLETIHSAALIAAQRHTRWTPMQAA